MKKSITVSSAFNLFGIIWMTCFVLSARHMAVMEGREDYDFADSATFIVFVMPVLFLCFIANIVWLVKATIHIFRNRDYRLAAAFMTIVVLWFAAIQLDGKLSELPPSQAIPAVN